MAAFAKQLSTAEKAQRVRAEVSGCSLRSSPCCNQTSTARLCLSAVIPQFRQQQAGDWGGVLAEACQQLDERFG